MKDKSLKEKAIKLKGKDYVQVADRVKYFNEEIKGSIETKIIDMFDGAKGKVYVVKATVTTPSGLTFTGLSQAEMGQSGANLTAALENAETSAVGRALGFMGIGVIDSIASADELHKAGVNLSPKATKSLQTNETTESDGMAGVCNLCGAAGVYSDKKQVYYCPNWSTHKEKGEFAKIVNATSRADDDFINSIPID